MRCVDEEEDGGSDIDLDRDPRILKREGDGMFGRDAPSPDTCGTGGATSAEVDDGIVASDAFFSGGEGEVGFGVGDDIGKGSETDSECYEC